ncbi:ATP-binding protein [Providencia rettgeri]|uniref:ATP-binding protein n=1 Tax=Providencia rettgeri TaxID=587 RepID=A0AAP2NXE0_PRORE|nr:ATP-binding protein [Providencia rettgeri]MBX6952692.1 ATP-binding protein [Providencia rettgeri]MBX6957671.1 ATP-binding protein [Providencia rettgeri]MBX6962446.1 ATP-binding protein [Providencia rettgeri]MBX6974735.1 ATP-binding protein [Providencia rettgeri]MBX6982204.1 ATP-binding protein [Providencia rettgeri]
MKFAKALRKKAKLRLALTGPSGSGKTYGALEIAKGLGGKTALIDTEKGSASLYSDRFNFDVLELDPPFTPERFIEAIGAAQEAGYDNLIIDSITHEWSGSGGCLELLDGLAKAKYRGNTWSAWSEITPRHNAFLDAILRSDLHIIATMRSKTETAQVDKGNGKKGVDKLGMKSEQRDGVEYEFTTVLDLNHETHTAMASKDRTGLFSNAEVTQLNESTGKKLMDWLNDGRTKAEVDLSHFTDIAMETQGMDVLKNAFGEAYKALRDTPEQAEAQKIYELRKEELTKQEAA